MISVEIFDYGIISTLCCLLYLPHSILILANGWNKLVTRYYCFLSFP